MKTNVPVALIILDGWGVGQPWGGNAIYLAKTPFLDKWKDTYLYTEIIASGEEVGLLKNIQGNSESGHLNLGAGRIVFQDYPRINALIKSQSFFENKALLEGIQHAQKNKSKIHLMGLLSDGTVHSHIDHLKAILILLRQKGITEDVYIHAFSDGRDTGSKTFLEFYDKADTFTKESGVGRIASVSGRYFAMDRDNRWDRVQKAYDALTLGTKDPKINVKATVQGLYDKEITDEFIEPFSVIEHKSDRAQVIDDNDVIIYYNFRPDRVRELSLAFIDPSFKEFNRIKTLKNLFFISFVPQFIHKDIHLAFQPINIDNTLGQVLSQHNYSQFHIAESEKYAHVTYFFNGGIEEALLLEKRVLIPSPRVSSYDTTPRMSLQEVTDTLIKEIKTNQNDCFIVNIANPDMVGHTGNLKAAIEAARFTDECLGKIVSTLMEVHGTIIITADHGNIEQMINPINGEIDTHHTANQVPLYILSQAISKNVYSLNKGARLADVAPTVLQILNLPQPLEMTGISILKPKNKK